MSRLASASIVLGATVLVTLAGILCEQVVLACCIAFSGGMWAWLESERGEE